MMHRLKEENGFTVQELLVVLVVGSLLFSFCFSLFSFVDKVSLTWRRNKELKNVVHNNAENMAFDIQRSIWVARSADSLVTMEKPGKRLVEYRWASGLVARNGALLTNSLACTIAMEESHQDSSEVYLVRSTGRSRSSIYETSYRVITLQSGRALFNASYARKD